jgi:hypothetical protein
MAEPATPAGRRQNAQSHGSRKPGRNPDSQGEPGNPAAGSPGAPEPSHGSPGRKSAASSTGSSTASRSTFLGNRGPVFAERDAAPEVPGAEPEAPVPGAFPDLWDEEKAATILRAQGALTHAAVGVADNDWRWLDAELDAAAGPLASALNRYTATQALARYADGIGFGGALLAYTNRSLKERARALGQRVPTEEPVTGHGAEPIDVGPAPPAPVGSRVREALDGVLSGRGRRRAPQPPATDAADAESIDWRPQ